MIPNSFAQQFQRPMAGPMRVPGFGAQPWNPPGAEGQPQGVDPGFGGYPTDPRMIGPPQPMPQPMPPIARGPGDGVQPIQNPPTIWGGQPPWSGGPMPPQPGPQPPQMPPSWDGQNQMRPQFPNSYAQFMQQRRPMML